MNDAQLTLYSKLIATAMKGGDMDKVSELYGKVSATASMEEAAKLEGMIAANMG
ncbi:MAG: hypothetical protein FWF94_02720 [Oscillospiraceae bacterium]|nr:hypothetical protein [Oscillospiraceae bacterium]